MNSFCFGFYSLSAVVAAAVSQSKKAVSPVAAAVVGIGLFLAPMESVQAQSNPAPPTVSSVTLTQDEASDSDWTSNFSISVDLDLGGSGWCVYRPGTGICSIAHGALYAVFHDLQDSSWFGVDRGYFGGFSYSGFPAYAGGGYYMVEMWPR